MEILDNLNELGNKILKDFDLNDLQENFLESNIGQIANTALDIGLRNMLPDFVENEVIDIKNALIKGGVKEGINSAIENAIQIGKKVIGIGDSAFESIGQAQSAIENGNLTDGISKSIDEIIDELYSSKIISQNIYDLIKGGKNLVLNNISTNVEDEFLNEMKALEKIDKYIENWEKYYLKKDIDGVTKEYNKIEKQMKKILPLETTINNVNKIRNINDLIKYTKDFDFSDIYLDLAKKF